MFSFFRGKVPSLARNVGYTIGAVGLIKDVHEHKEFEKQMSAISPADHEVPQKPNTVETTKYWHIVGRYSDPLSKLTNIAKHEPISELTAAHIGCEKNSGLFADTKFELQPMTSNKTAPNELVGDNNLLPTEISNIPDSQQYVVAFAKKEGFKDILEGILEKSPFYHGALAFREIAPDSPAEPGDVVVTGKELKQAIDKTNQDICEKQHCDFITSNCYTGAVGLVTELAHLINTREADPQQKKEDLASVRNVLATAVNDNFGKGIYNNPAIREKIGGMAGILEQHGLTEQKPATPELEADHRGLDQFS